MPIMRGMVEHFFSPGWFHACCGCVRRSISFLRQKARAQKARKLGLSGLLASFPYINFAHLIGQIYVFFRVLNDAFHRGKKSGLMHVVAEGGGGKRRPFCRRMVVKAFHANTHNMQESQDNAADSVGLMIRLAGLLFLLFSVIIRDTIKMISIEGSSDMHTQLEAAEIDRECTIL